MTRKNFIRNYIFVTLPVLLVAVLYSLTAIFITIESSRKTIETINGQTVGRIRESAELVWNEADVQSLNYSVSAWGMMRLEELLKNGLIGKEYMDTAYMIKTFLDSTVNSKPFLHSIYIYLENEKENFFASSLGLANVSNSQDTQWLKDFRLYPPEYTQWFKLRQVSIYASSDFSIRVISLFKRLYSSDRQIPVGVLVMNIDANYMESFCRRYLTYPGQRILLLNIDGTILCGADAHVGEPEWLDTDSLKKSYFIAQEKNSSYGLSYLSLIPRNVLFFQAAEMMRLLLCAVIFILALGGGFAWFVTRQNTQRQMREKKNALAAVQFSLLQSQLNPHFLFNTLKNIFWKTVRLTGTTNDASRMIDLLSTLLRYTLVNRERFVLLEEEIENTKKYIEIQQMRFDHSFYVSWIYPDDIVKDLRTGTKYRCIKFILQPLVENSISHGIRGINKGKLEISLDKVPGGLAFSVADNGCGFTGEEISEITGHFAEEDPPVEHTGLYNLNKRLVLAYGPSSTLSISNTPGKGARVRFFIPTGEQIAIEDK
jgi:two-component system sensor histidine kinase YesM